MAAPIAITQTTAIEWATGMVNLMLAANGVDSRKFVQTIRTELVWRFNSGGRY